MSDCPGISSTNAGYEKSCAGCPNQSNCRDKKPDLESSQIKDKLSNHLKIAVLSGKGGVGKSTITFNLGAYLSKHQSVCIVDLDITGPTIPVLCKSDSLGIFCQYQNTNLFSLTPSKDTSLADIFLENTFDPFGTLLFDTPPNITDSHLFIAKHLCVDFAIIVSQPSNLSLIDCRRMLDFCSKANIPVLGVVCNMNNFVCEHCSFVNVFTNRCIDFCKLNNVNYLGDIPLKKEIAMKSDLGQDCIQENVFEAIYQMILEYKKEKKMIKSLSNEPE